MQVGQTVRLVIPESETKFVGHSMNGKLVQIYSLYKTERKSYAEFGDRDGSMGAFREKWFEQV